MDFEGRVRHTSKEMRKIVLYVEGMPVTSQQKTEI